jgi:hypothetical protein
MPISPAPDTSDERLIQLIRWTGKAGMPDIHVLLQELQRHRALVKRLEEWAKQLEARLYPDHDGLLLRKAAIELRNRMKEMASAQHLAALDRMFSETPAAQLARDSLAPLVHQDAASQLSDDDRTALQYLRDKAPWRDGHNDKCHEALIRAIDILLGAAR